MLQIDTIAMPYRTVHEIQDLAPAWYNRPLH